MAALRAAAANPVHAYLFRGPAGNGGLAAALRVRGRAVVPRRRVRRLRHLPRLRWPGRTRTCTSSAAAARRCRRRRCARSSPWPSGVRLHAARQVIVVLDVHLVLDRAPVLLKTLEEPPGETVFVLLADDVTPDLVTIASRCVEVPFPPVPREDLVRCLVAAGVPPDTAAVVADSSGGNPERARVMVDDPDVAARVALWTSVPDELHGVRHDGGRADPARARVGRPRGGTIARRPRTRDRVAGRGGRGDGRARPARAQGDRGAAPTGGAPVPHRRPACGPRRAGPGLPRPCGRRRVGAHRHGRRRGRAECGGGGGADHRGGRRPPRNPNEALLLQSLFVQLAALAA